MLSILILYIIILQSIEPVITAIENESILKVSTKEVAYLLDV